MNKDNLKRLSVLKDRDLTTLNALTPYFQIISESLLVFENKAVETEQDRVTLSVAKLLFSDLLSTAISANGVGFKNVELQRNIFKNIRLISSLLLSVKFENK